MKKIAVVLMLLPLNVGQADGPLSCQEYLEVFAVELVEIQTAADNLQYELGSLEAEQSRALFYLRLMIARERMRELDDQVPSCAITLHEDFTNFIEVTADTTGLWSLKEPIAPDLAARAGMENTDTFLPLIEMLSETGMALYAQIYDEFLAVREKLEEDTEK
jgi:hypothetical protein